MRAQGLERASATAPGRREGAGLGPEALSRGYFGVSGLDDLLPAGLTYDTQMMVTGETGVGKSVLAAQFLYEGLLVGDNCVFIACDEPPNAMRQSMAGFRLGTVAYEQAGRLAFVDAYARERSHERYIIPEPNNLDEFYAYESEVVEKLGGGRVRLVVDSLSTVFGTASRAEIIDFNRARLRYLRAHHVFTLDNYVLGMLDEQTVAGLSHSYPLIVKLGMSPVEGTLQRWLQLGKLRSGQFSGERRQFRIDPRAGLVVVR